MMQVHAHPRCARFLILSATLVALLPGCDAVPRRGGPEGDGDITYSDGETLLSTVQDTTYGQHELVARNSKDDAGEWQFTVRAGRATPKDQLKFVWDFGDGESYEGTDQTYTYASGGKYTIVVEALEPNGQVAFTLTLSIEVAQDTNQAPLAVAGADQVVDENELVFLFAGDSSDPDGDPIEFSWTQTSGPPVLLLNTSEATASFIAPTLDADADLTFTVRVSDGRLVDADAVAVRVLDLVAPAETGPIADAGPDQLVTAGQYVALDGRNSEAAHGSLLQYEWSQLSGPVVMLSSPLPGIASFKAPNPTDPSGAKLLFELLVTSADMTSTDEVVVIVKADDSPDTNDDCPEDPEKLAPGMCGCGVFEVTGSGAWTNTALAAAQSGAFELQFEVTPTEPFQEGIVALSHGPGATFADYAVLVRFNSALRVDVRNGVSYSADTTFAYTVGSTYHIRASVDVRSGAYSVDVAPEGGSYTRVATEYAFRSDQSTVALLDSWGVWSEGGPLTVCAPTVSQSTGCTTDTECDDDNFCNGPETCVNGTCLSGAVPCAEGEVCDDANHTCTPLIEAPVCTNNSECDDGSFCNGLETCVDGDCTDGAAPCLPGEMCDEGNDECLEPSGNVYYVAKNDSGASDSNSGTEAHPWKTLSKAAATAQAGDTVLVKAGTYYEALVPAHSGTPGNMIVFKAYATHGCRDIGWPEHKACDVVIDGTGVVTSNGLVRLAWRNYIRIEGFEITKARNAHGAFMYGEGNELVNNKIHSNGGPGQLGDGVSMCGGGLLADNLIYNHWQSYHSDGIQWGCGASMVVDRLVIRNNIWFDNGQEIGIAPDTANVLNNVEIYSNLVYKVNEPADYGGGGAKGIFLAVGDGVIHNANVYANTVANVNLGIVVIGGNAMGTVQIRNNILYDTTLTKVVAGDFEMDNNLYYLPPGSAKAWTIRWDGSWYDDLAQFRAAHPTQDRAGIEANPLFTDVDNHNYDLAAGSPAVDAGDPFLEDVIALPAVFLDVKGTQRPIDVPGVGTEGAGALDIGAYERTWQ